jgi:protein O-GlcNAc transferase
MNRPGRNDPCPCGSGKKYKKCCLPKEEAQRLVTRERDDRFIAELRPELDEAVDRLLERLERGEGKSVESDITELLKQNPDYHMTNFAMGVYQAKVIEDPTAARRYFQKAAAIFPPFAEAHFNLAMAARQAFDIPAAVESFLAAERYAQDGEIAALARNELQRLEDVLLKTTNFPTLNAYVANAQLFDRAFECLTRQEYNKAAEMFQRVLKENPDHVQSHGNLALAYAGLGRRSDALACLNRALELDPDYEPARENRHVVTRMREGEPCIPDGVREVEFYADRLRDETNP